ncbi:MAG: TraB/GumN family protein [Chitinophagaceae bacterium]|nr:TraB/GumN family protein [Chitinophagaceae bacterium]
MAQQAGVFYTVTGNGLKDTSYLFGTYHLIKSSYLENKTAVQHAFNKAKGIVVETIIDSSQLMAANAKGLLQKKELKGLLGNHFADTLDAELKGSIGAGLDQFNSLKPMTVMITLSLVQLMKDNAAVMNGYSGSALDVSFAENGKAAGKIITPLETIFEQMDFLFNSLSDEQQAEYLKLFIRNKSENTKMGNELLQAYLDNDLAAMHRVYEKGINISGDMEFLVTGRNNNWMKVLPGLMKNQSQFIAVGALHLCGKTGLVDQLQQMGFKVTAINL